MRIVLLGFVLLFAGVARLSAAVYFVDFAGGSDANAGINQNLPWKHCPGDPAATGMASAVPLVPGDTVRFKGGVQYVFSGPTGIRLEWSGAVGAPIIYDGNSDGSWGTGRAVLTDQYGANAVTAFSSAAERRHLVIKAFEFFALGGAAVLPADAGVPVAGRFGGGIAFTGGGTGILVEDCVFRELGFWESQKPMAATSLTGVGLRGAGSLQLTIRRCAFSRVSRGCDFSGANLFSQVKLDECVFGGGVVWPLDLPIDFGDVAILAVEVTATIIPAPNALFGASWTGYGRGPLVDEVNAAYGEPVIFSASALASPAASFQWYKNGVLIPGGFGPQLNLGAVDGSAAGIYSAVATNPAGSAQSNSIVLVVTGAPSVPPPGGGTPPPESGSAVAPTITQQPVSATAAAGGTVTFTVAATGTPAPTYQWEKNGVAMSGATSAALTLVSVSSNDNASYRVVVSNVAGTVTSAPATLTVTQSVPGSVAPTITQQPVNASVEAGGTAMFTVVASGNPAPTYQWQKNGVSIPGATGPVLTLTGVTINDIANYRVTVTNAVGSVTSVTATLIVNQAPQGNVAPTITQQPVSATAAAGGTVTFTVAATGNPAPTYQWEKNGVAMGGATSAALTLVSVSSNDNASYRVVVSNVAGTVTSAPATLTVTQSVPGSVAPTITQQPVNASVEAGGTAMFTVVASGNPAPTYQWQKNGVSIPGATGPVLTLTGVTINDIANYRVTVTNAVGSVTSVTATLIVNQAPQGNVAPTITQQPVSATAAAGGTVTFTVAATGTPAPTYQWEKNGVAMGGATSAALTLVSVSSNDNASYRVVVSNVAGTVTSASATLTVTQSVPGSVAPTITQQPVNASVEAGGTAMFTVVASGNPAPTYQWQKNGVSIPGATGPVLTFSGVSTNDSANYRVVVSNVAGSVTSVTATLTVTQPAPVNVAPTITQQPVSATVAAGGTVTFTVAATGTPAPTYQWEKNGVAMSGATSAALTLASVSSNDNANYRVVVSNVAGTVTSAPATLTVTQSAPVNVAPTITQQPVSATVAAGGTVTFTVAATGTPAPTYQWEKNGVAMSGATSAALTLASVSSNDNASYRVVVSNVAGTVTSAPATLTVTQSAPVNVAPTITQQPVNASVEAGGTAMFTVVASGNPAPTYQWRKNGVSIPGATGPVLTLSGVSTNDNANYRVVVTNVAGSVTSVTATLIVTQPAPVNVAPTITQQPVSATVAAGGTVTFTVAATGTPAPSYQWEKNGVAMSGATSAALTLASVSSNDNASYRVVVSNVAGTVTSASATLTVTQSAPGSAAPTITQQPVNASVEAGGTAMFTVVASGNPAPTYQWEKNGVALSGATSAVLTLNGVSSNDNASYRVVVSNVAGTVTSESATLTVVAPTEPPPAGPQPPIVFSTVQIRGAYSFGSASFEIPAGAPRRYLIRALGPTLAAVGGSEAIADPKFEVYHGSTPAASNDNWAGNAEVALASSQVGAVPLVSWDSRDAASIVTLAPGFAVILVSGVNGATGNALIEVYLLP